MKRSVAFQRDQTSLALKSLSVAGLCVPLLCLLGVTGLGQTYVVLHSFTGEDGAGPAGGLVLSGTALYGTTAGGGAKNGGTLFRLNTDGSGFKVLRDCESEQFPFAGFALSGTTLYATTAVVGSSGSGSVFKIKTGGSGYAVLHTFTGSDGWNPYNGLVVSGTTLYGTAGRGGAFSNGVAFKLSTDGTAYTVLKDFTGSDGARPTGFLVLSGTNLYGTTGGGGSYGSGTVYRMNTDGSGYQVLRSFAWGPTDGGAPAAGLLLSGSTLYGTCASGGKYNFGTVFRIETDGSSYDLLKEFPATDEAGPWAELVLSGNTLYGTSYGTVSIGGVPNYGAVFKIKTDGSDYEVIKHFAGGDGANPRYGGPMVVSGTTRYGTTDSGGTSNRGVVFAIGFPPLISRGPQAQTAETGSAARLSVKVADLSQPFGYSWFFNKTNLLSAGTNSLCLLTNIQPSQAGAYTVVVTNLFGASTSPPAMLGVIPPVPRKMVPAISLTSDLGSVLHLSYADTLGPGTYWQALDAVTRTATPQFYPDLTQPLPSARFYRAWQTNVPSVQPALQMIQAMEITLAGSIGSKVRVDCINQFGPTDAWMMLDTVAMTNTAQPYFDFTMFRQPARLYRLVPVP